MNIRGTALLVMALVLTITTSAVTQSIGLPGMVGLFYGILPRKEFKVLFIVSLVALGATLINSYGFLFGVYSGIMNSNNLNFITTVINNNSGNNPDPENNDLISGFIIQLINLPINLKNIFPENINLIGEFIGAGLFSLILFIGITISIISILFGVLCSTIYISNYFLFRNLFYPYLPDYPTISNPAYNVEMTNIMTASGLALTVLLFFGTMMLTHWLLRRVGFYKRLPTMWVESNS